jgi:hypothetical protein
LAGKAESRPAEPEIAQRVSYKNNAMSPNKTPEQNDGCNQRKRRMHGVKMKIWVAGEAVPGPISDGGKHKTCFPPKDGPSSHIPTSPNEML